MPVDTSIYSTLGVRPKSALEYGDEMDMSALRRQNLQTNALAMQGTQQKLDEGSRLVQEQAGVRNRLATMATQQPGATDHDRANALYAVGTPTAIAMADKLRTAADNSRKTNSEATNKDTESENRIIGVYRDLIGMANDPATAARYVQTMHADPRLAQTPMAKVPLDQAIQQIGQDPQTFGEWKQKFALGAAKYVEQNKPQYVTQNLGGTSQITALPGLGGGPASVVSSAPISQSPDNIATNATHVQTTGMTNATTRAGQASTAQTAANALEQGALQFKTTRADGKWQYDSERGGQVNTQTGEFRPAVQGGVPIGPKDKPLTEAQGKATKFLARMADASSAVSELEAKGTSSADLRTKAAGSDWTNWIATPEGQQYKQAASNWLSANLRDESGAAIGILEENKDYRKFFPQLNDDLTTISQKARSRRVAEEAMRAEAGPGAKQLPVILQKSGGASGAGEGTTPKAGGGNTVTTPDGKVHTFPNAAAAAQFKKAAGL